MAGPLRHLDDRLGAPVEADGHNAMRVEIGEPQLAVAPAGRLGKRQAVEQYLKWCCTHARRTPPRVGCRIRLLVANFSPIRKVLAGSAACGLCL